VSIDTPNSKRHTGEALKLKQSQQWSSIGDSNSIRQKRTKHNSTRKFIPSIYNKNKNKDKNNSLTSFDVMATKPTCQTRKERGATGYSNQKVEKKMSSRISNTANMHQTNETLQKLMSISFNVVEVDINDGSQEERSSEEPSTSSLSKSTRTAKKKRVALSKHVLVENN